MLSGRNIEGPAEGIQGEVAVLCLTVHDLQLAVAVALWKNTGPLSGDSQQGL